MSDRPMNEFTDAQLSALIHAQASWSAIKAYQIRIAGGDDEQPRRVAQLFWVIACLWIEIERFARR